MKISIALAVFLSLPFLPSSTWADEARDYVHIVGSSSLLPFATAVADRIAKTGRLKHPKLESTGTSGGFSLFCEGTGMDTPDIVNASRPMSKKEFETCRRNGVNDIVEVKAGYDAIVIASQTQPLNLSRRELYLALAKTVPDPACLGPCETMLANPYRRWKQINPDLPEARIEVLGPPFNSGISEIFAEAVLEKACNSWLAVPSHAKEAKPACTELRKDGVYSEETSAAIAGRLADHPNALGLFSYIRLRENGENLQAAAIESIRPDHDSIASRKYPLSFPLFFYVKKAHLGKAKGLEQYLAEFTREETWGEKGYLATQGL
ncbi:MAG: substrate-binding domain-containing protein, partial [Methylococcaceae bacterium]|nr:substrate-binding domain-containing protein [Methylococcaceae bacterium]